MGSSFSIGTCIDIDVFNLKFTYFFKRRLIGKLITDRLNFLENELFNYNLLLRKAYILNFKTNSSIFYMDSLLFRRV